MTTRNRPTSAGAEVRALVDNWTSAVRAKDARAVASHFAADVVTFDLAPPLRYSGANALEKSLEEWFSTFHGSVGYEVRDLSITAGDDIAFSHSLNRISGKRTGGEETDVWVRATVCYRKIGGKWTIVHEHSSVPFYMDGSYKAAVDLKPWSAVEIRRPSGATDRIGDPHEG